MGTAATEMVIAGQTVIAAADYETVTAICAARRMTQDDGRRAIRTIEGDEVTFNIAAVAMIRKARVAREKATFGFARALEVA